MAVRLYPKEFEESLEFAFAWEGGEVDDEDDPGGHTNYGITQVTYDSWQREQKEPRRSVADITKEEAKEIYYHRYWRPNRCSELPGFLGLVVFDTGINCGVGTAARLLQRCCKVEVDGTIGPQTLRAANGHKNPHALAFELISRRRVHYDDLIRKNPKLRKFLKGWRNRLDDLLEKIGPD